MAARSYLYVPGDRPDRLEKAVSKAGDALIADLEDAVAPSRKDVALAAVLEWIPQVPAGVEVWVRIGAGPRAAQELAAIGALPRLDGVILAKASVAAVAAAAAILPERVRIGGLVETAAGVLELPELARQPRVSQLGFGEADLVAELGIARDELAVLGPLRAQLVVASAAAGINPPTAPVHLDLRDLDGLRMTTEVLKRAGFGARSAIHPDQVAVIEAVFTPTADEVARSRSVVEAWDKALAAGTGVAVDEDGRFVDEAVVRPARRVLETASRLGL
jgi:citrate lyase subunit beta/citryl-CoA lyase